MHGVGGGGAWGPDNLESKKKIQCLFINTGSDLMKNHKATKPAFNVGPSWVRGRNPIEMTFDWRADDGPLLVEHCNWIFSPSLTEQYK